MVFGDRFQRRAALLQYKIALNHIVNYYHLNINVFGNNCANRSATLILAESGNRKGNRVSFYSINRFEYRIPCLPITSSVQSYRC
jgi:hypothetical protein